MLAAGLLAPAVAAHGASFGAPRTLGTTTSDLGGATLVVTDGGRAAWAAPSMAGKHLFVVTRGRSGGFSSLRKVALPGRAPAWPIPIPLARLALDEQGRMVTMVFRHRNDGPDCCTFPAGVFMDSAARVTGTQALESRKRNSLGILHWNSTGTAAVMTHGRELGLALARPGQRFRSVALPKAVKDDAFTILGPGRRLAVWLHDRQDRAAVVFGDGDGDWSGTRTLGGPRKDRDVWHLPLVFGPSDRALAIFRYVDYSGETGTLHAVWVRGTRVERRQKVATIKYPEPAKHHAVAAIDAAGRGTVVWSDGRALKVAHASPGGEFGSPKVAWRAPQDHEIWGLNADGARSGAVAAWLSNGLTRDAAPDAALLSELRPGVAPRTPKTLGRQGDGKERVGAPFVGLDSSGGGLATWWETGADGRYRWRAAVRGGAR